MGLTGKCSGGVYPRLNGGYRRCPATNRLSELFIDEMSLSTIVAKLLAGINPISAKLFFLTFY